MSALIGRLLVLFYVITIPVFLGLYVASMVSAQPKYDALWIDGGVTEYGPAAFLVLLAIFVFPVFVSVFHYLISDALSYLKRVLIISAWMAPWPIGSAIVAKEARAEFPMAITMIKDDIYWGVVVCVIGVAYSIHSMHEELSLQEKERLKIEGLSRRYGVSTNDVREVAARLSVKRKEWDYFRKGKQTDDHYVMLHLRALGHLHLSVDDYWSFVGKTIGDQNFFLDDALSELDRHVEIYAEFGGTDKYFHWLAELRRFKLCDKSFPHSFDDYRQGEVSLRQCLNEYRVGEFTSVAEYLEFLKASPPLYVSAAERAKYQAEADKMTHPVLHRMLELGGFYRARALHIAQRSSPREIPVALAAPVSMPPAVTDLSPAPVAATSHPESTPYIRPGTVLISRRGRIILNDVKLQNLSTMVVQGHVLLTDHYWCSGMAGWSLVSTFRSADPPRHVPEKEASWREVLADFFLSWLLYILGGVFIAGLLGYGRGGLSGVGPAIGGFLGFIILVRPVSFVFRILFRLIIGKRGMELFR